jgi:hypothetical protein
MEGSRTCYLAAFALRTGALYSDFFFKPNACTWSELLPNCAMTCSLIPNTIFQIANLINAFSPAHLINGLAFILEALKSKA